MENVPRTILRIINNITYEYVYFHLKYNVDYTRVTTGQIPKLNQENLKSKIKIPLPSLEIQEHCITLFDQKEAYIESIDKKIAEHKKYLEELKALAKDVITSFC